MLEWIYSTCSTYILYVCGTRVVKIYIMYTGCAHITCTLNILHVATSKVSPGTHVAQMGTRNIQ